MGIRKQNANGISAETFGKINRMTEREGNVWRHRSGKWYMLLRARNPNFLHKDKRKSNQKTQRKVRWSAW